MLYFLKVRSFIVRIITKGKPTCQNYRTLTRINKVSRQKKFIHTSINFKLLLCISTKTSFSKNIICLNFAEDILLYIEIADLSFASELVKQRGVNLVKNLLR